MGSKMPKVRKDFSFSAFVKSPEFLSILLLELAGFALLFVAIVVIEKETIRMVVTFLAIAMTFSASDQLIKLFNEKKYGIKTPDPRSPFQKKEKDQK